MLKSLNGTEKSYLNGAGISGEGLYLPAARGWDRRMEYGQAGLHSWVANEKEVLKWNIF